MHLPVEPRYQHEDSCPSGQRRRGWNTSLYCSRSEEIGALLRCIFWVHTMWEALALHSKDYWGHAGKSEGCFSTTMETKTVKLRSRQSMRRKTTVFLTGLSLSCKPLLKKINLSFGEAGKGVVISVFRSSWELQQIQRQGGEPQVSQEGSRSDGGLRGAGVETPERWEEGFILKTRSNVITQQPGRGSLSCKVCKLQMRFLSNSVTKSVYPHTIGKHLWTVTAGDANTVITLNCVCCSRCNQAQGRVASCPVHWEQQKFLRRCAGQWLGWRAQRREHCRALGGGNTGQKAMS